VRGGRSRRARASGREDRDAEHVLEAHGEAQFVRDDRPQIAFVGRSNVGKSSLMNRLLGRKGLARTSSTPGKDPGGPLLPGQPPALLRGPARLRLRQGLRERPAGVGESSWSGTSTGAPAAPLVVLLVDAKVGATRLDVQARGVPGQLGVPLVVAATKADRLSGAGGGGARGRSAVLELATRSGSSRSRRIRARESRACGRRSRAFSGEVPEPSKRNTMAKPAHTNVKQKRNHRNARGRRPLPSRTRAAAAAGGAARPSTSGCSRR
jgi:hypothetical protein